VADVILTGGGTGGHVYPALAVAAAIRQQAPDTSLLFVGTPDRLEARVVPEAGFPFFSIPAQGLSSRPWQAARAVYQLLGAFFRARALLRQERPRVILGTGGYVSAPVLLAARSLGIPYFLHEQNVVPGKVNRALAKGARCVFTSLPGSERYLPAGKVELLGNPVRQPAKTEIPSEVKQSLGFPSDAPLLVITGGSQGARRLNEAVLGSLSGILEETNWSVCLVCGPSQFDALKATVAPWEGLRFQLHAYIDQLPRVLSACDLVVGRAGATTLAELTAFGRPMVLVPYPYAGGHQRLNAAAVVSAGAAVCISDDACDTVRFAEVILPLMLDEARLNQMAAASRACGHPDAGERLASQLLSFAGLTNEAGQ
jgi:UDP-N-acetylglucosamine--N-acetylmuramyl-(pentapeptide) pyrophosphoryl-undecaprenol N-acetylglucosamine transferase